MVPLLPLKKNVFCYINNRVCVYNIKDDKWMELSEGDFSQSQEKLARKPVAIAVSQMTGNVFAIKNCKMLIMQDGEWVKLKHFDYNDPAVWWAVYHDHYIITCNSNSEMNVYQLLEGKLIFRMELHFQRIFNYASARICNGAIYVVGVQQKSSGLSWVNRVFKTPLSDILPKTLTTKSSWFNYSSLYTGISWQEISSLPVIRSTCVSFNDHLLAVGGLVRGEPCGDIFLYDEGNDKWNVVGRIPTPHYNCLVEAVGNQLVVIGGWLNNYAECDLVEIATLSIQ